MIVWATEWMQREHFAADNMKKCCPLYCNGLSPPECDIGCMID